MSSTNHNNNNNNNLDRAKRSLLTGGMALSTSSLLHAILFSFTSAATFANDEETSPGDLMLANFLGILHVFHAMVIQGGCYFYTRTYNVDFIFVALVCLFLFMLMPTCALVVIAAKKVGFVDV